MNTEISRNQLINIIKGMVGEKQTGTLYVRTEDSRSIVVGIDSGEIVTLICGSMFGEKAIPALHEMVKGTYHLQAKVTSFEHLGARPISNESLLSLLTDDVSAAGYDKETCDWVHDVLCKTLAAYMGPIAPLVCRETVSAVGGADSPDKLRRVVDALAVEIGNPGEAQRFKSEVSKELDRLSE